MTENEKIGLFDEWYDENYDEWAEGEEGIALREELEQAFKGGIQALEKENAELRAKESFVGDQNRKLCEQQQKIEVLEVENAELKESVKNWLKYEKETQYHKSIIKDLKKENAELRKDKKELCHSISEGGKACVYLNEQLTKAKDHIKKLLDCLQQDTNDPQTNYYVVKYMTEAEQFIKDSEVEKC